MAPREPSQTTSLLLPSTPARGVSKLSMSQITPLLQTSGDSFLVQNEPQPPCNTIGCPHASVSPGVSRGDTMRAAVALSNFLGATLK